MMRRLRDHAETASDWYWESGPDHRFTYLSKQSSRFGIDRARWLGQYPWSHAADFETEPEKWRRHVGVLERREPFRGLVYQIARDDGSSMFIALSGRPVFDTAGQFIGYRGAAGDVTIAGRADRALRAAMEEELRQQAQKIAAEVEQRALLECLVDAQERERSLIAHALHDQMGQDITGLALGLKGLETLVPDGAGRRMLRNLERLTAQIGRNLHRTAWELRPTSLDDIGLLRALDAYVGHCMEHYGLRVDLHVSAIDGDRFGPQVETAIYRAVQEGLTNVRKHAEASMTSVVLERHEGWLQIIIEDDGRGFDPEAAPPTGRLGLASLRGRLSLVGGSLAIDSAPSIGTTLYVRIPLPREGGETKGTP